MCGIPFFFFFFPDMEERPTEKGGGGGLILNFVLKLKDIKGECPFDNSLFPFVEEGASSSA